jgi:hypothetical protein
MGFLQEWWKNRGFDFVHAKTNPAWLFSENELSLPQLF